MEEVVGSIPTRSTIYFNYLQIPRFSSLVAFGSNPRAARDLFQGLGRSLKLGTDGVDRLSARSPESPAYKRQLSLPPGSAQYALNVFHCPFFCARVAIVRRITWKVSLGSSSSCARSVQNPIPVVVAVHEPAFFVREDKSVPETGWGIAASKPKVVGQFFRNVHGPKLFRVLPQGRILPCKRFPRACMVHSVWLKHCQRSANSSPGRSAFVMSSSKRMRSLGFSFESAPRNC